KRELDQIKKAAANVSNNQTEPRSRNLRQKENTDHAAEERRCFHCGYPAERRRTLQSSADQKTAQCEAFRNFVNAQSREKRPGCRFGRGHLGFNSQSQTIG